MPTPPNRAARAAPKTQLNQRVSAIYLPSEQQLQSQLFPIAEVELDGVAMGVLSDGTPYLHMRGLARMCGIDNSVLHRLATNWPEERLKPRGQKVQELLTAQGFKGGPLYFLTNGAFGETHAYTDDVCMAILEYYAFEATQASSEVALRNYRLLARSSFKAFIYKGCGYEPDRHIPEAWRTFHERILLNDQMPIGYFSIFREMADLVVHMIKGGCPLDTHTVPDISVGMAWAKHWNTQSLAQKHGERIKHPHNYPDWFPQAEANPVATWIYPVQAMGDFKLWMYQEYVGQNLPRYIDSKVKQGVFVPARAKLLLSAVQRPALPAY